MRESQFQPVPRIYVRNNSDESFIDRYDGEDFEIKPGEVLPMPVEAARLCLGYGEPEKGRAIARKGWAPTAEDHKIAIKRLNKFSFHGSEEEAARAGKGQSHAPLGSSSSSAPSGNDEADGSAPGRSLLGKIARAQESAPA